MYNNILFIISAYQLCCLQKLFKFVWILTGF